MKTYSFSIHDVLAKNAVSFFIPPFQRAYAWADLRQKGFSTERPFKGEDPQVIFETLNSLGRPLTLSDLVRNYILLGLRSNDQTEVYDNIWYPNIEKVLEDDTSYFFRDYLQYKKSTYLKVVSDNNTKELYQEFKEFVENEFGERVHTYLITLGFLMMMKLKMLSRV